MMRISASWLSFVLFIGLLPNILCRQHGAECTSSIQCDSYYCRNNRCINYGESDDDVRTNPCSLAFCAGGPCVLEQIKCDKPPCPPMGKCAIHTPPCCKQPPKNLQRQD